MTYIKFVEGELRCSNRTFMELKCVLPAPEAPTIHSSNRTFMELK